MNSYTSNANLDNRLDALSHYGHDSSIWLHSDSSEVRGHLIEILSPNYVSQPCWDRLFDVADYCCKVTLDFKEDGLSDVFQFFFTNIDIAIEMAQKVQSSARNKRKDLVRDLRLVEAGGFHTPEVIEQLFSIQQGKCYYSGEILCKSPKNYVVDHIQPICQGGSDWPVNLALVVNKINTWKGGHFSSVDTLKWLSKSKGKVWLTSQKVFCALVDKNRCELDIKFRANKKLPGVNNFSA